jgi:DNA polymerase-4
MWIRGWESGDVIFDRKSFGNSYSLPIQASTPAELAPILAKLVHKTTQRMRTANYQCGGVHLSVVFRDYDYWHKGTKTEKSLFDQRDIHREAYRLLERCPYRKPVKTLAVSVFNLSPYNVQQLSLFDDVGKKAQLTQAVDEVNHRFGAYCLTPGMMIGTEELVPDRIAFGGVKELQDFVFEDE